MLNEKITKQDKCMPIFSQKLCSILLGRGFVLQGMAENKKMPSKNVFYFIDSVSIRDVIAEYTSAKV